MRSTVISYRPKFLQIVLSMLVIVVLYALAGGAFYLLASILGDASIYSYLDGSWPVIVLFPVMCSVIHAYSSRQHQFCVSGLKNAAAVTEWTIESLKKEGLRVRTVNGNEFVLESKKKYNRTLGHWLGTELVKVTYTNHQVKATGHYRYTDVLNSRIRSGKTGGR
ncbi:hypothetical protein [Pontibacter pudoricolor]|uniref:hypothetical protein n=1 Tax=Pontibacter pudoricolor TaxID=2694930 RepID=UPI001391DC28|nr:hypothetical protein [Pontibacter pudoricolor]